jgi:hypothetical protein
MVVQPTPETYGPGVDPASNRNEYQEFSWPAPEADYLTAICEPNV